MTLVFSQFHVSYISLGLPQASDVLCAPLVLEVARLASAGHVGWPLQGLQDAVLRAVEPWRPSPVDGGGWPC